MTENDRLSNLENEMQALRTELTDLRARESIRQCIYSVCRAIDRVDSDLLRSAFHPGATIHFGRMYDGPVEPWIASTLEHQVGQSDSHHLVGNIQITVAGDQANAESYELARHKSPIKGKMVDLVLAMRTLDRFALRDGAWRISERTKIIDWGRIVSTDDAIYEKSFLEKGVRGPSDASYRWGVESACAAGVK